VFYLVHSFGFIFVVKSPTLLQLFTLSLGVEWDIPAKCFVSKGFPWISFQGHDNRTSLQCRGVGWHRNWISHLLESAMHVLESMSYGHQALRKVIFSWGFCYRRWSDSVASPSTSKENDWC